MSDAISRVECVLFYTTPTQILTAARREFFQQEIGITPREPPATGEPYYPTPKSGNSTQKFQPAPQEAPRQGKGR